MFKRSTVVLQIVLLLSAGVASAEGVTVRGWVTDPGTPQSFEVDGQRVLCDGTQTMLQHRVGDHLEGHPACPQHSFGQELLILAAPGKVHGALQATSVELLPGTAAKPVEVKGRALSDAVLSRTDQEVHLRDDGYVLWITPRTHVDYDPTLKAGLESLTTNQWISYHGMLFPDGHIAVTSAYVTPNVINGAEDHLRKEEEFDPAAVTEGDRQNAAGRFFTGLNRKRMPAAQDEAMQSRIATLGQRLVPAYQRALPATDPSRIDFRFQVVHERRAAVVSMSNGIILVSDEAATRLQNDAQLAFLLGVGIAQVLQKQELRLQPVRRATDAAVLGAMALGALVPGAGLAGLVGGAAVNSTVERRLMESTYREALCLMHGAGFAVREAPVAARLLEAKKPGEMAGYPLSEGTRYLYTLLGTVWAERYAAMQSEPTEVS